MKAVQQKKPVGSLKISKDVIATIAAIAVKEVDGVADIANMPVDIKGLMTKRQSVNGITVSLTDEIATINVKVLLCQHTKIPVVAEKIQAAVKESVQGMTGVAVSIVNVIIVGIKSVQCEN